MTDLVTVIPAAEKPVPVSETGRRIKNGYVLVVKMSDGSEVLGYGDNYDEARLDSRKGL